MWIENPFRQVMQTLLEGCGSPGRIRTAPALARSAGRYVRFRKVIRPRVRS
jgi:hypothetical protein